MKKILAILLSTFACLSICVAPVFANENETQEINPRLATPYNKNVVAYINGYPLDIVIEATLQVSNGTITSFGQPNVSVYTRSPYPVKLIDASAVRLSTKKVQYIVVVEMIGIGRKTFTYTFQPGSM